MTISPNLKFKSELLGAGRIFYCKEFRVGGGTVLCVHKQSLWAVSQLGHKDCEGSREHCWVREPPEWWLVRSLMRKELHILEEKRESREYFFLWERQNGSSRERQLQKRVWHATHDIKC